MLKNWNPISRNGIPSGVWCCLVRFVDGNIIQEILQATINIAGNGRTRMTVEP